MLFTYAGSEMLHRPDQQMQPDNHVHYLNALFPVASYFYCNKHMSYVQYHTVEDFPRIYHKEETQYPVRRVSIGYFELN